MSTGAGASSPERDVSDPEVVVRRFANGDEYRGAWRRGAPDGNGLYRWADGSSYQGTWEAGMKDGVGKHTWANGVVYAGEWQSSYMHGMGSLTAPDGTYYCGAWSRGRKHGLGRRGYGNGDCYEGLWRNGEPEGPGSYRWADGNVYNGEWKNGKMHGRGEFVWKSGERYDGEWAEGSEDGTGLLVMADGSLYDGFWQGGTREGVGIYWPSAAGPAMMSSNGGQRAGTGNDPASPIVAGLSSQPPLSVVEPSAGSGWPPLKQPLDDKLLGPAGGNQHGNGKGAILREYSGGKLSREEQMSPRHVESLLLHASQRAARQMHSTEAVHKSVGSAGNEQAAVFRGPQSHDRMACPDVGTNGGAIVEEVFTAPAQPSDIQREEVCLRDPEGERAVAGLPEESTLQQQEHSNANHTQKFRRSDSILKQLCWMLRSFACALIFSSAVRLFILLRFWRQEAQQEGEQSSALSIIDATISSGGVAGTVMDLLVVVLGFCAAHHAAKAAAVANSADKHTRHKQGLVLYLSPLFKSYAAGLIFKAMVSAVIAAVLLPEIVAVMTGFVLLLSLLWWSAFVVVRIWFSCSGSYWVGADGSTDKLIYLLSAPQDELDNVPGFIKFCLTKVFGRLSPKRNGSDSTPKGKDPFKLEILGEQGRSFSAAQMHVLKLLYEAMMVAVNGHLWSVFTGALVVATIFLSGRSWSNALSVIVDMLKDIIAMFLILVAALYFSHALAGNRTDTENLFYGFASLGSLFQRLTIMYTTAAVIQLIGWLVPS